MSNVLQLQNTKSQTIPSSDDKNCGATKRKKMKREQRHISSVHLDCLPLQILTWETTHQKTRRSQQFQKRKQKRKHQTKAQAITICWKWGWYPAYISLAVPSLTETIEPQIKFISDDIFLNGLMFIEICSWNLTNLCILEEYFNLISTFTAFFPRIIFHALISLWCVFWDLLYKCAFFLLPKLLGSFLEQEFHKNSYIFIVRFYRRCITML